MINTFPNNCLRCEVFSTKKKTNLSYFRLKNLHCWINNTSLTTKSGLCQFSNPKAAPASESLEIIGRFSTNKQTEWCVRATNENRRRDKSSRLIASILPPLSRADNCLLCRNKIQASCWAVNLYFSVYARGAVIKFVLYDSIFYSVQRVLTATQASDVRTCVAAFERATLIIENASTGSLFDIFAFCSVHVHKCKKRV